MAEPEDTHGMENEHLQPMVERSRFGVSESRKDPMAEENRPLRSPVRN